MIAFRETVLPTTTKLKNDKKEERKGVGIQRPTINRDEATMQAQVQGIRTRTSPMTLHDIIDHLTLAQRNAVKDMGLKTLLQMTVDGIPVY